MKHKTDERQIPRFMAGDHCDGMNKAAARAIVVVGAVPAIATTIVMGLVRNGWMALRYTWIDVRAEARTISEYWRGNVRR